MSGQSHSPSYDFDVIQQQCDFIGEPQGNDLPALYGRKNAGRRRSLITSSSLEEAYKMKKKKKISRTMLRASTPRFKMNKKMKQPLRKQYVDPGVHFTTLTDTIEARIKSLTSIDMRNVDIKEVNELREKLNILEVNYCAWVSVCSSEALNHVQPYIDVSNTIMLYFPIKQPRISQDVLKLYKEFYYSNIVNATGLIAIPGYDELLNRTKENNKITPNIKDSIVLSEVCKPCNNLMYLDPKTTEWSCSICGKVTRDSASMQVSYTQSDCSSRTAAPYERLSHFKEFLSHVEGTESTIIPCTAIKAILHQCKLHRINPLLNPEKLTYIRTRQFLSITGYTHLYENITKIISIITKQRPPYFTLHERNQLTQMFKEIQKPFEKHKGKRKNFLSYAYTVYKCCQLLNLNRFFPYLPKFKSHKNTIASDQIWQKICNECGYEYSETD